MSSTEAKYNKMLKSVSANLKKIRNSKKLSQSDMTKFGFELRNYQRIESGSHSPSLFTLHRLAIALDCEIKDFF